MHTSDEQAWSRLCLAAQPAVTDSERGHRMYLAAWRVIDGGVVEYRYQAFCRCYWSQTHPSSSEIVARRAYDEHGKR